MHEKKGRKPGSFLFSGAFVEIALFAAIMIPVLIFAPWLITVLMVLYFVYAAITGKDGKGPGQYGRYDGDGG